MRLTVGQEKVVRASFVFELHNYSVKKTVRYMLQKAIMDEAIEQRRRMK